MLLVMKATVTVDEVGRMVLPKNIREAIEGCLSVDVQTPQATGRDRVVEIAV